MHSDFTPVVHTLDGRTVKVYVIGDVHLGAPECDVQGFKKVLAKIAADDDAYLVLVGDILNNATKDSLSNVYEETMPPSAQIELAAELLTPVKDKILGMVAGNHESRSRKAVDLQPLLGVAYMIGAQDRYRTNLCFIRVVLKRKSTKNNYTMLLVHGKTANKRKQFQYSLEGVDIVCSGHVHQGLIEKPARICMTTASNVVIKPLVSIVSTSFLSYGGYAAAGLYLPAATSCPQYVELPFTGSNSRTADPRVVW